jgi:hypothetical protein
MFSWFIIVYCETIIWVVNYPYLAYNDYDGFQHLNFIFWKKIISILKGLINEKIHPMVDIWTKIFLLL